jgi:hypothetical protein
MCPSSLRTHPPQFRVYSVLVGKTSRGVVFTVCPMGFPRVLPCHGPSFSPVGEKIDRTKSEIADKGKKVRCRPNVAGKWLLLECKWWCG